MIRVRKASLHDPQLIKIKREVDQGLRIDFTIRGKGAVVMSTRLYVPALDELKREILDETHRFAYTMHPGALRCMTCYKNFISG